MFGNDGVGVAADWIQSNPHSGIPLSSVPIKGLSAFPSPFQVT